MDTAFSWVMIYALVIGPAILWGVVIVHALISNHRHNQAVARYKEDLDWIEEHFGK